MLLPFPAGPIFIMLIQSTVIPALFLLSRQIGEGLGIRKTSSTHLLAAGLGLLSPIWLSEIGTSFFESWTAPLILWSLYFLLRSSTPGKSYSSAVMLAGIGLGLATGIKLTNAPFAVAAVVLVIWLGKSSLRELFSRLGIFSLGGILGVLPTAWWNLYLALEWDSPIFPFFNSLFRSSFYDQGNWRDMRWFFESPADFALFVFEAGVGTNKTSELVFADARFLVVFLLIGIVLMTRLRKGLVGPVVPLLIFFLVSLGLWATIFAYQRYFVAGELLMGLLIWALLNVLAKTIRAGAVLSAGVSALVLAAIAVPSWGHIPPAQSRDNPFSVQIPAKISESAASYLAVGRPVSYIFPQLHPDSNFHGVGVSAAIDRLIVEKISGSPSLPVRALARLSESELAVNRIVDLGVKTGDVWCVAATSALDNYVVCGSDPAGLEGLSK
jgi:hypothetical protein